MNLSTIYKKALDLKDISLEEGVFLFQNAPLEEIIFVANEIRKKHKPGNEVTWMIDRNVNITNVCISNCKFCNFHRTPNHQEAYITTIDEYKEKINTLFKLGGDQLLLQGGLHPKLGLGFYKDLFKQLKSLFPSLKLHALGPAEIVHISKMENLGYREVLRELTDAGLDSLPGGGAEILCDRVRQIVSPGKCKSSEWLDVMHEAHILNLPTSATMMFGHAETIEERCYHLIKLRDLQNIKPQQHFGFISFIPWPFQDENTVLKTRFGITNNTNTNDYIRTIALSRIILNNIQNIQASWLTTGISTGQIALHAGANDFGSIMIEENVVSSAGANNKLNADEIQKAIFDAGFVPKRRNQKYEII
jgi:menaquinone biosynthesis protein, SCO4550 family